MIHWLYLILFSIMKTPPQISKENLAAILKYIPVFDKEGFEPAELIKSDGDRDVVTFPAYSYCDEVLNFVRDLYDNNIIYSFDWPAWEDEAVKLYKDPKALASADLDTLRKLLTIHVRKDRFSEGHLAAVIRDGHVLAILKRLADLL